MRNMVLVLVIIRFDLCEKTRNRLVVPFLWPDVRHNLFSFMSYQANLQHTWMLLGVMMVENPLAKLLGVRCVGWSLCRICVWWLWVMGLGYYSASLARIICIVCNSDNRLVLCQIDIVSCGIRDNTSYPRQQIAKIKSLPRTSLWCHVRQTRCG